MLKSTVKIKAALVFALLIGMSYFASAQSQVYVDQSLSESQKLNDAVNQKIEKGTFYLFSHGRPGELFIQNQWMNENQIVEFVKGQTSQGQITKLYIYGCEFAKGRKGEEAVNLLEQKLSLSVAASNDVTGLNGDWDLEIGSSANSELSIPNYLDDLQCSSNRTYSVYVTYRANSLRCTGVQYKITHDGQAVTTYVDQQVAPTGHFFGGARWNLIASNIQPTSADGKIITKLDVTGTTGCPYSYIMADAILLVDDLGRHYVMDDDDGLATGPSWVLGTNVDDYNGSAQSVPYSSMTGVNYFEWTFIEDDFLPDNDRDGVPDECDLDDDNDGILDSQEGMGDLDNDGSPNSFDRDSDGDGCPDALESMGNMYTYADLINGNSLSIPVDPITGIPGSTSYGLGSSQDPTIKGAECDSCNSLSSLFTDADGDGIGDACDLDNDNDGILDSVEGRCESVSIYTFNVDSSLAMLDTIAETGGTVPLKFSLTSGDPIPDIGGTGIDDYFIVDITVSDFNNTYNTSWDHRWATSLRNNGGDYSIVPNEKSFYYSLKYPQKSNFSFSLCSNVLPGLLGSTNRYLEFDEYGFTERLGTFTTTIGSLPVLNGGYRIVDDSVKIFHKWNLSSNPSSFTSGYFARFFDQDRRRGGFIQFDAEFGTTYESWYTAFGNTGATNAGGRGLVSVRSGFVVICKDKDTDGDGTPDYKDNDSDGDGCFDAVEGDGSYDFSDVDSDGRLTAAVDSNGVVVTGTQGVGTSTDATVIECNNTNAEDDINQTEYNVPVSGNVLTNDSDPDGETQTVTGIDTDGDGVIDTTPTLGTIYDIEDSMGNLLGTFTIDPSTGIYIFSPDTTNTGGETYINYQVCDSGIPAGCDIAELVIDVIRDLDSANYPPIAHNDEGVMEPNTPVTINVVANDNDPDGELDSDDLTLLASSIPGATCINTDIEGDCFEVQVPNEGTWAILANGDVAFVPLSTFTGPPTPLDYAIKDSAGNYDTATISVYLADPNVNEMYAEDDANIGLRNETLVGNVTDNDIDPDGSTTPDSLSLSSAFADIDGDGLVDDAITFGTPTLISDVQGFTIGTLILNTDGSYSWNPETSFSGNISVIYTVCDNDVNNACDDATLYLTNLAYSDAVADFSLSLNLNPAQVLGTSAILTGIVTVEEVAGGNSNGTPVFVSIDATAFVAAQPYDATITFVNGQVVENPYWIFAGLFNGKYFYRYIGPSGDGIFLGGSVSKFTIKIEFSTNGSSGVTTVTANLFEGSGGDVNVTNDRGESTVNYNSQ